MKKETVIQALRENKEVLSQFNVRSLSVFGSVARDESGPESDVDILVEFEPGARAGLFTLARLQRLLQKMLGAEVDLVTPGAIHPEMKDGILEEAINAF